MWIIHLVRKMHRFNSWNSHKCAIWRSGLNSFYLEINLYSIYSRSRAWGLFYYIFCISGIFCSCILFCACSCDKSTSAQSLLIQEGKDKFSLFLQGLSVFTVFKDTFASLLLPGQILGLHVKDGISKCKAILLTYPCRYLRRTHFLKQLFGQHIRWYDSFYSSFPCAVSSWMGYATWRVEHQSIWIV